MTSQLRGVCAAVVTPLDAGLRPDAATAIEYYGELLRTGCDSLNVLGTTGEASSISTDERLRFMEAIAHSGLPRERMMVGTGTSALADCIRLTAAANRFGFGAALVMPPYFFRGISDDGVLQFFDRLIARAQPPQHGILLYNFPAMSGIAFHPDLVDRLMAEFPGIIGGMKDSSNDANLQEELHRRHPELLIFPSSEAFLNEARERGYAGCISGTVALWCDLAARVWRGDAAAQSQLTQQREIFARVPIIAGVRYVLAQRTGNKNWLRTIPPLTKVNETSIAALDALAAI